MEIVLYPDPRLRAKNKAVESFDATLFKITRKMFDLMYETEGVGLAAPQVGINYKLLVYNPTGDPEASEQERVLCNPSVIHKSKETEEGEEGCLSFPEIRGSITRPNIVEIEALDLQGREFQLRLEGWESRIFQHELDHLKGVLFIDRFSPADKSMAKSQLDALANDYREAIANSTRN